MVHVTGNHCLGTHGYPSSDSDAAKNDCSGCNPRSVTDVDRCIVELEGGRSTIMTSGAEQGLLGDANMGAYDDRLQVEQPGPFADPGVVTNLELPRPVDAHPVPDEHPGADPRAKEPQDGHPDPRRTPPPHKDRAGDEEPESLDQLVPAYVIARTGKPRQITRWDSHAKIVRA